MHRKRSGRVMESIFPLFKPKCVCVCLYIHAYLSGMLLKRKKSIQIACRNTAGALTAAEILQTLQNGSCWRRTHSPPQKPEAAQQVGCTGCYRQGQLLSLSQSLQSWLSLEGTRLCSQDWPLKHKKPKIHIWEKLSDPGTHWSKLTGVEVDDPTTQKRWVSAPVKSRGSLLTQGFLCYAQVPGSATNKAPGSQAQNPTSTYRAAPHSHPLCLPNTPGLKTLYFFHFSPLHPHSRVLTILII